MASLNPNFKNLFKKKRKINFERNITLDEDSSFLK